MSPQHGPAWFTGVPVETAVNIKVFFFWISKIKKDSDIKNSLDLGTNNSFSGLHCSKLNEWVTKYQCSVILSLQRIQNSNEIAQVEAFEKIMRLLDKKKIIGH